MTSLPVSDIVVEFYHSQGGNVYPPKKYDIANVHFHVLKSGDKHIFDINRTFYKPLTVSEQSARALLSWLSGLVISKTIDGHGIWALERDLYSGLDKTKVTPIRPFFNVLLCRNKMRRLS